jgi:two-component system, NarL family, sensor histidine kinase UhpB
MQKCSGSKVKKENARKQYRAHVTVAPDDARRHQEPSSLMSALVERTSGIAAPNLRQNACADLVFSPIENPITPKSRDPNRLATYLQSKSEKDKAQLSQELHDNLGGLIVASMMDAASAEQHLPPGAEESLRKLQRLRQSLGTAIDLKRKIIEHLRPTLLDNVGLFAALGWLLKHCCAEAKLKCSHTFPVLEPRLNSDISIGLFRFVQEALHDVVLRRSARSVDLKADVTNAVLTICITHDGKSIADTHDCNSPEFESLKHRIRTIGGEFAVTTHPLDGSTVSAVVRLDEAASRHAHAVRPEL